MYNGSALIVATKFGREEIVRLLLESGADVNFRCEFNGSALQAAANEGHEEIARLLLENGADVNRKYGQETPLLAAILGWQPAMIFFLIQNGADPTLLEDRLYEPAMTERRRPQLQRLLSGHGWEEKTKESNA